MNVTDFLTDDMRVLHRLHIPDTYDKPKALSDGSNYVGLAIDTETTGLGADDVIFEVAVIAFEFDDDLNILGILDIIEDRWMPDKPLSRGSIEVCGIDIDELSTCTEQHSARITKWLETADVAVCHNSAFDRPKLEAHYGRAVYDIAFMCTIADLNDTTGMPKNLVNLCTQAGFYFDGAHGALPDTMALFALLNSRLPISDGSTVFEYCLTAAESVNICVIVKDSPYAIKDRLYSAGLRWNPVIRAYAKVLPEANATTLMDNLREVETATGVKLNIESHEVDMTDKYTARAFV